MRATVSVLVGAVLLLTHPALGAGSNSDPIVGEATSKETVVLAEFMSKTCPACEEMRPVVEAVLSRRPAVRHLVYDADFEVELTKKYRVRCVPVYVVVDREGEVRFNDVGMLTEEELEKILHGAGAASH